MPNEGRSKLPQIIRQNENELLTQWVALQMAELASGGQRVDERHVRDDSRAFLTTLQDALQQSDGRDITGPAFVGAREYLDELTKRRLLEGFSPSEIAT